MALLRSTATVGFYTLASRIFGFVRDMLVAAFLGTGPAADAFVVAFRIPNLFRRLTAEGAFNAAFVPVFAGLIEREGRPAAEFFAAQVLSIMLVSLVVVTIAAEIFMPVLVSAIAPGFVGDSERFQLAVDFTRLTFPFLMLVTVAAIFGAMLNTMMRFAAAAAAPVLFNAVMAAAALFFAQALATPGHIFSAAVTLGGVAQLAFVMVACRRAGLSMRPGPIRFGAPVRRWLSLLGPGALGAGVMQLNLFIGTLIASLLPTGAIAYLYYADRVNQLPLGVIGVAIGTALLPLLSRRLRAGDEAGSMDAQNRAIELGLLLTLPATAALLVIPYPIVAALFERGAFDGVASIRTAEALAAYALGLPAYVLTRVLAPGFFAREDTKTPVKIAIVAVLANALLALALIGPLAHVGVALATSAASWLNALLLAWILARQRHLVADARLRDRFWRMVAATLIMVATLHGLLSVLGNRPGAGGTGVLALGALVAGGGAAFMLAALALRAVTPSEVKRLLARE